MTRRASHSEVREAIVPVAGMLDVDAAPNGDIQVRGSDRTDALVRATVVANARTDADARRIVSEVRIETGGGRIGASGPNPNRDESWSVSFDVDVPRTSRLTLKTDNGGLAIDHFRGTAQFRGRNGAVSLRQVGGDIRGETANGEVTIDLDGDRWDGAGLDVKTVNGDVSIRLPERYSAELETGTVNGEVTADFPITSERRLGRRLATTLGGGGARIRAMTTNGTVTIRRR